MGLLDSISHLLQKNRSLCAAPNGIHIRAHDRYVYVRPCAPPPLLLHSGLEDIDTFAEDRSHVKASALSRLSDLKFETTSSLNQGTDRTTPSPKKCRIKVADVGHVVEFKQQTISLFLVQCTCT